MCFIFSNGEIAVASTIKTSRQGRVYHPQFIVVYHQNAVLHIIKSQIEYTRLSRDDIHQRKSLVVIYNLKVDDIPSLRLG